MADTVNRETRSRIIRAVRGKNTGSEMAVRRLSHAMGFRHRLHAKGLPGRPDLVYPGRRKAVFVHGCFWHRHIGCRRSRIPDSNREFWKAKFRGNRARDRRNLRDLAAAGWECLVVWECELADPGTVADRLRGFLCT